MACLGYHQNIPCGTTAPLGSSFRMGVPEGGIYSLNQLTTPSCPIGGKHQNLLQGTLYYQK